MAEQTDWNALSEEARRRFLTEPVVRPRPDQGTLMAERCMCAHDGHAGRCPVHTQDDFEAADRAREGTFWLAPIEAALNDDLTLTLDIADWACDPLPSNPNYASVNPDWLRAMIVEAKAVRAALAASRPDTPLLDETTTID